MRSSRGSTSQSNFLGSRLHDNPGINKGNNVMNWAELFNLPLVLERINRPQSQSAPTGRKLVRPQGGRQRAEQSVGLAEDHSLGAQVPRPVRRRQSL